MHDQIRRAIDDAFNRGGMTVGLPKVAVDASQLKHLLDTADALRVRIAELEAALRAITEVPGDSVRMVRIARAALEGK